MNGIHNILLRSPFENYITFDPIQHLCSRHQTKTKNNETKKKTNSSPSGPESPEKILKKILSTTTSTKRSSTVLTI